MKWAKVHYSRGFTIVELLIVIVVVAILAAITVTAFNGVQQRARNSQMISAARVYANALRTHVADKGTYPTITNFEFAVCLGAGYPDDHCWIGTNGDYYTLSTFDASLATYIPEKPKIPVKYYQITSQDSRSGITYFRNAPTGRQSIEYLLDGSSQSCGLNGATAANVASNTATRCTLTLPSLT